MISNPRPGQVVQVWYRAALRADRPLHGLTGVVEAAARDRGPRNHAVRIGGVLHSIPAGQLRVSVRRQREEARPRHEMIIPAHFP